MTAPDIRVAPYAWWDNQIDLHPPKNGDVAQLMDNTRAAFKDLGHNLIRNTPAGPDQTLALRALILARTHDTACRHLPESDTKPLPQWGSHDR